jgi:hypothetical protein
MPAMSESFVDLSYRGLTLGKRIKLTKVRPATGYLEMPTPMPVGTAIGIATDDGVLLEATVAEVHEQVSGSDRPPGMLVRPKLEADAGKAWWKARVELPAEPEVKPERAVPVADAIGKVTLVSRRDAVPELMDDGRNTSVMEVASESNLRDTNPSVEIPTPRDSGPVYVVDVPPPRDSNPNLEDDGKRTVAMDAVDLAALGLDPSSGASGQMAAVKPEDYADDNGNGSAESGPIDTTGGSGKKKKRKRR